MYEHSNYQGACVTKPAGTYNDAASLGPLPDNAASSGEGRSQRVRPAVPRIEPHRHLPDLPRQHDKPDRIDRGERHHQLNAGRPTVTRHCAPGPGPRPRPPAPGPRRRTPSRPHRGWRHSVAFGRVREVRVPAVDGCRPPREMTTWGPRTPQRSPRRPQSSRTTPRRQRSRARQQRSRSQRGPDPGHRAAGLPRAPRFRGEGVALLEAPPRPAGERDRPPRF